MNTEETETIKKDETDEINNYLNAHYVSESEACWRIFNFDTNGQNPHTIRLPVHTENCQIVTFNAESSLNDIKINNSETPLTHYLKLNKTNTDVRDIFYYQMPLYYIWNSTKKLWTPRQK